MSIGLRIGINGAANISDLAKMLETAAKAEADGFDTFWVAQIFGLDALTALAVTGREVPRIELGTAVVPTYPRHPQVMAGQALTVQAATGDRLALGIGLSHQIVVESLWGYSYAKPVRYMREYLDALLPLLRGESSSVHGEDITSVGGIDVVDAGPPPVIVAALGEQMLNVAGRRGCGTITWCTGLSTLAEHIVPTISAAAEGEGHATPRVVAGLPVSVTNDVDATRAIAAETFALYGGLPSYRAMLDREGVEGPADVAIIGDEAHVAAEVTRMADAGVTDFSAVITASSKADHDRTWDLLGGTAALTPVQESDLRCVSFTIQDRVATLTLNRPHRLNAWTGRMHFEYRWCLERADADDAVRVIVVTGAGRGFCAGADAAALEGHAERGGYDDGLPATPPTHGHGIRAEFDTDFAYHFGLATPIIAAVNGPAAGVGLVLACYCDLRFAAAGAKLTTAHGKLNLPAEYGLSWLLPRLIGVSRAMDLLLTSRVILAEEALAMGLVNRVFPVESLLEETLEFARHLSSDVARRSLTETRRQVWADQHRDVRASVEAAGELLESMIADDDYNRGVQALLDKRPPDFH